MRFTLFNLSTARRFVIRFCVVGIVGMSCAFIGGCATAPAAHDPLEPFNRSMFEFNDAVDRHVLKPVATGYEQLTPLLFRQGVSNFFANLYDVWSGVNNALQLKPRPAADSLIRVLINSTVGLLGVLDVATEAGIERHPEDFGQTLGYWGVGSGPYLVLPLLGPSTLRDTAALTADFRGDLVMIQGNVAFRNSAYALRGVNRRAKLLRAGNILEEASFDKYTFVRDAFLQRRRYEVLDGNVPDTQDEDSSTATKVDAQSSTSQPKE
jgi:phospholipid-binding lipoprotein MlaA